MKLNPCKHNPEGDPCSCINSNGQLVELMNSSPTSARCDWNAASSYTQPPPPPPLNTITLENAHTFINYWGLANPIFHSLHIILYQRLSHSTHTPPHAPSPGSDALITEYSFPTCLSKKIIDVIVHAANTR